MREAAARADKGATGLRSRNFVIIAVLGTCLWIGCTHTVQVTELRSYHDPSEIGDIPIVVVGRAIENSHPASPIGPSTPDGEPRQLWCVRVRIEHVLKGSPLNGDVNIFYFVGDQIPGSVGRLFVYAGHYEVFLLQKENGKLRTVCKDRRTCVYWVRTGAHPSYVPNPALPIEDGIADLMLSRGPYTSDGQMIDAIYHSRLPGRPSPPSGSCVSSLRTKQLRFALRRRTSFADLAKAFSFHHISRDDRVGNLRTFCNGETGQCKITPA